MLFGLVRLLDPDSQEQIGSLRPGDTIAEECLLHQGGEVRKEAAVALKDSFLLEITKYHYKGLFKTE